MKNQIWLALFCLVIFAAPQVRGDGPDPQAKIQAANTRFSESAQKASDGLCHAMIAAQKGLILDYTAALRDVPKADTQQADRIKQLIESAKKRMAEYQTCMDQHTPLLVIAPDDPDYAVAEKALGDARTAKLPPSDPAIGMTEAQCDAIESARSWTKSVVLVSQDSREIHYDAPRDPWGVSRQNDDCIFRDGKLVTYAPTRFDYGAAAGGGRAQQVSPFVGGGH